MSKRKSQIGLAALSVGAVAGFFALSGFGPNSKGNVAYAAASKKVTQGTLYRIDREGRQLECPLKRTDVKADISGFIARVTVTQEFENTASDPVEAVYVFPLPQNSAVDDMTIQTGNRTIKGLIKERGEARRIYEQARQQGKLAGLLDQERPNIFTQSLANLMPGVKVKVLISYVERLPYEDGTYEFMFPMVVGPRYIPGNSTGRSGGGWADDTDRVPDASKITPPVAPPATRAGHDITVSVSLDAGVAVSSLESTSHEVSTDRPGPSKALVRLKEKAVLPNKDFVLRYHTGGKSVQDTLLAHRSGSHGYFTFLMQPPDRPAPSEITPKELVFVLDTSGSMMGFPIDKAKEAMSQALNGLNPRDTFNLITFAGDTHILFPQPVPATSENLQRAQTFLSSRRGGGGTEMMKAIRVALDPTDQQDHVRIVCFMTDGYVGNETEIIREVQRHPNARVFSFGIGSSVNRYLLDKMAEAGRGEVEYVSLTDDGSKAAKRFHERVHHPLLTDISIDYGNLPVTDVYPQRIPDLFSAKPLALTGRFTGPARGVIRVQGKLGGRPWSKEIPVDLPATESRHNVLSTLWARTRVDYLMHQQPEGEMQAARGEILKLGLEHRLMTPFTSFVAVEEKVVNEGGTTRRVEVPVEMPEGVSHEGVFGEREARSAKLMVAPMATSQAIGVVGGMPSMDRSSRGDRAAAPTAPPPLPRVREEGATRVYRDEKKSRLDPALSGPGAAALAVNGKVRVKIHLTANTTAETIAQLKQMGIEVLAHSTASSLVLARVPLEKLEALSKLAIVDRVEPAR